MKIALKKKKIFIAGHNGMVGSSILRYFKKLGLKNIIIQNRKKLDLTNWNKVNKFLKKTKPDIVINCAGKVGGILANFTYPKEFLFENIYIQLNLLDACFKNNIRTYINLGSSCIYPKKSKQPIKEDYLLSGKLESTNEAYAIAKIVGLKSCEFYNKQFKTNYFTLMPCNMYGPNDNFEIKSSHFIPGLIKKFYTANRKNMKNVEVWGSGKAKREIMHVDDLASAIFFMLNKVEKKNKKVLAVLKKNSHINIGTNKEYTIKQYANMIGKLFNKKINLKFNKSYPDGTPRKLLDSSIIYSMGWKPIISIEKGLRETLEWYKENVK
jgi:GDP-L-fucose synthase